MHEYIGKIERVIDADTLLVEIDLGFGVFAKQKIRLIGVDTPEIYGVKKESVEYARGLSASNFTLDWAHATEWKVVVKTIKKDKTEKYGRYLAVVTAITGPHVGKTLQECLIESGHDKLSVIQKSETD